MSPDDEPGAVGFVPGAGTPEARWRDWPLLRALPELSLDACRRVVVVAPHPDDETLAVGGVMALALAAGAEVVLLAATDGEASHPDSRVSTPQQLRATRTAETHRALAALGSGRLQHVRLHLPDGALAEHEPALAEALGALLRPGDWCLVPFEHDAHPDHEAAARAGGSAARRAGARLLRYPLWAWHWSVPGDPRVPWEQAVRVWLPAAAWRRKQAALACYPSQTEPLGPGPQDAAVVPPGVLAHFERPYEVLLA